MGLIIKDNWTQHRIEHSRTGVLPTFLKVDEAKGETDEDKIHRQSGLIGKTCLKA